MKIWVVVIKTKRAKKWSPLEMFWKRQWAEKKRKEVASKWPHMDTAVIRFIEEPAHD